VGKTARFGQGPNRSRSAFGTRCARVGRTYVSQREEGLARRSNAAVAQLGPIHLADDRALVVGRLIALLREAYGRGARFVVFPELALTTFFRAGG